MPYPTGAYSKDFTDGWTANKLLKGAGAGSNPTEIDPVSVLPSGLIMMWHGPIANIPSGFVICDGNNGTPNLLAKFVEGVATAATDPGATGGATSKTTNGHTHSVPARDIGDGTSNSILGYDDINRRINWNDGSWRGITQESGFSPNNYFGAVAGTSGSQTDSISDIRPPYYDVAFIMKT